MYAFFETPENAWMTAERLQVKQFVCGYCYETVSSDQGFLAGRKEHGLVHREGWIYICPACQGPIFVTRRNEIFPGGPFGSSVTRVPKEINDLYEEARKTTSLNCYNAAVMLCRKILMHVAVELGAEPNQTYLKYVEYFSDEGYIPPQGKHWVDHIRKKANEANHEITLMERKDAGDLITFVEMLLRTNYEFPNQIPVPNPES